MLAETEAPILLGHVEWVEKCTEQNINWIKKEGERNRNEMEQGCANESLPTFGINLLQALAPENVGPIKMVHLIMRATNPAKLIITAGALHVVASALFFFDDYAALWAICQILLIFNCVEIFAHGLIELRLTILALVIR